MVNINPIIYHTFAIEWIPGVIRWYIDDALIRTYSSTNVPDVPLKIYMNMALGGSWPGSVGTSTVFPQYFYVDYVRVYKLTSFLDCVKSVLVNENQQTDASCTLVPTGCPTPILTLSVP
jgi:beta-glucanase (GH16 family)